MSNERRLLIVAVVSGTLLRILQTATSLGSLDAMLWYRFAGILDRVGVLGAYTASPLMNHPPLALVIARVTNAIGLAAGLEFQDSFRFLQIAADVVTALVLVRIARHRSPSLFPALLFFLSPAVLFISAFHCNSDPLMMMFVVLAVAAVLEERPVLAGLALACAVGIKVVPLFAGPLFLIALNQKRARLQFLAAAVGGAAVIFGPAIAVHGTLFLERVFGYTGFVRGWGIPLLAHVLRAKTGIDVPLTFFPFVLIAAVGALWISERQRKAFEPHRLPALVSIVFLLVLVFAPGYGIQYLYWPLPFLAFALSRRMAVAFHAVVSAYLFAVYTAWSGGWPWWFAEKERSPRIAEAISKTGLVVWVVVVIAAVMAVRRSRESRENG